MLNNLKRMLVLLLLPVFILVGCSKENMNREVNSDTNYYTFTDSRNNRVVLKKKPERVVSLIGSYGETWVLSGGRLIGVTDDVISEGRMEKTNGIKIVGSIKEPNVEEVLSLSPDFVLLSPDVENHIKISETLKKLNIQYAFFKVEDFDEYLYMLDICTDITGNKDLYQKNGLLIQEEINDILSKINRIKNNNNKPSILFIRAFSKGAKAKKDDNTTCKILDKLGTINIASKHKSLLEELSIEEIIQEDPDYIFVTAMGNEEKAIQSLKNSIEKNPAWSNLQAVKNNRYIVLPKELFHYKPNAKWGESYKYLAKIIYPEIIK